MGVPVLIADDHRIVREGIRALLERDGFTVVAEAENGWEAVRLARAHRPAVAVLDLSMPGLNGLAAAQEIRSALPRTGIVLLTMHMEEHQVETALKIGIHGYVLKTQAPECLNEAIRAVASGASYLSPSVASFVVGAYLSGTTPPPDPLTARDRQVLQLVADGKSNKEIASELKLSVKTAESYRSRLMEKLDIHSTAGLVRYAIRLGLVTP